MDSQVREMLDHFQIRNVLALYCHGCDRADADLMGSVYSAEGSFDNHGIVRAPGPEYAQEMTVLVRETTRAISHTLGQSIIQVTGDSAKAETFFIALMTADGDDGTPRLNQLAGRFVDRLERLEDGWKIKHRTAIHDLSITLKIQEDALCTNQLIRGSRDANDPGVALLELAHLASTRL